jgi:DNA-binding NarL/FixJ family response regulator
VLLVEDSVDDVNLFTLAVRKSGAELELDIVNDGEEALRYLKHLKRIPVIVMTTSQSPADITDSYASGAACYLVKPDSFDDLKELIRRLCAFWMLPEYVRNSH